MDMRARDMHSKYPLTHNSTYIQLFQLVAMASIYLSIKIHSSSSSSSLRTKVTSRSIASTCNNNGDDIGDGVRITARHIESMEMSIMNCLDWRLHPPTSVAFVENLIPLVMIAPPLLVKGGGAEDDNHLAVNVDSVLEFSRFLVELSMCAYPFVTARPSSVALAAVLCGLKRLHHLPTTTEETTTLREAFR